MVQQPFVGPNSTLAMPAVVGQPVQYSPQSNFYQQQVAARLNGLPQQYSNNQVQQDSPVGQQQPQVEGLYQTRAPVYAPKPSYLSPNSAQTIYQTQRTLQQPSYFQTAATQPQAQQHSPARSLSGPQQQVGLSVRQLPHLNGVVVPPEQVSPQQQQQQHQQQQQQQHNQQQQMQQLIMSYQQQHQQQLSDLMQPNTYLPNQEQLLQQSQQQQQHVDVRWSQIEEQRQQQRQQLIQMSRNNLSRAPFSDRDSISTLSRFNQLDERRSVTMRSQYTSANPERHAQFGALRLTGEALRRLVGLSSRGSRRPLDKDNLLQRNMSLASAVDGTAAAKSQNGLGQVTVIDSAEEHFFKRKVFRYQLAISRTFGLLAAAVVLLSPVLMLLVPKMEPLLHSSPGEPPSEPSAPSSVTHALGLAAGSKKSAFSQWRIGECSADCDGPLVGFVVRLIMLAAAYWALFLRPQTASLPRLDFFRCLLLALAVLITAAYWLFFTFRLFDKRFNDFELQYLSIVNFALSLLDSLVLLHYLAVVLIELRPRKKLFCLKVVRSPDGSSRFYSCGALSIQKAAQLVLEKYHREFPQFGPYAEQLLNLEDEVARSFRAPVEQPDQQPGRSSRAQSPSGTRRSASRSSRHHSRRSPSPTRSTRSRSQRKSREDNLKSEPSRTEPQPEESTTRNEPENNSADQSSDANSRLKESSLETVRAANSTAPTEPPRPSRSRREDRDDAESVRSTRSRRSRSHRRRHSPDRAPPPQHHAHQSVTIDEEPLEEHERKLRRRRLRLLATLQDTFGQIRRIDEVDRAQTDDASRAAAKQSLGPNQAARALYPSIARSLQKYLRLTHQTGRQNLQSIYEHLSKCLLFRLSARTFLEKFVNQDPVWQQSETNLFADCRLPDGQQISKRSRDDLEINSWSLVCDTLVSRQIDSGNFFLLKQGQVSLLVTVAKLPHLNLTEEVVDIKSCKFSLGSNSESAV